jgi:hypothetical protein
VTVASSYSSSSGLHVDSLEGCSQGPVVGSTSMSGLFDDNCSTSDSASPPPPPLKPRANRGDVCIVQQCSILISSVQRWLMLIRVAGAFLQNNSVRWEVLNAKFCATLGSKRSGQRLKKAREHVAPGYTGYFTQIMAG